MWTYLHGKGGAQGEGRGEKQWGYPESFQEFSITLADTTEAHQPLVRIECMPCRVSTEVKKDERDSCGVVDMIENAWHPWRRRFPRSQCTSSLYCRIELAFLVQTQVRLEPPSEGGSVPRSKVGADLAVSVPWLVGTEGWRSYWPRSSAKDIKETHANEVLTVSWARVWTAWPARPPGEFCPWNPLRGCRSSAALSTAPPFLPSWRTSGRCNCVAPPKTEHRRMDVSRCSFPGEIFPGQTLRDWGRSPYLDGA